MASFKVISEKDFNKYQTAWLDAVTAGDKISSLFKLADDLYLYGYIIGQDLVTELISRVGIKKVIVSFVVDTTSNAFTLVLYGMDNSKNVVSNYYQVLRTITSHFDKHSFTDPASSVLYPDYVPYALVEQWAGIYTGVIQQAFMSPPVSIPASLFKVWYVKQEDNRLKSYSFDISAFKEAIFRTMKKASELNDNSSVEIYFAIRKGDPTTPLNEQDTFSVLLQWQDEGKNYYYFDLTVPCPVCCPNCP